MVFPNARCTPVSIIVCLKHGPGSLSDVKTRLQGWPGNETQLPNGQAQFCGGNKREKGICHPEDHIWETPTVVCLAGILNIYVITLSLLLVTPFALLCHCAAQAAKRDGRLFLLLPARALAPAPHSQGTTQAASTQTPPRAFERWPPEKKKLWDAIRKRFAFLEGQSFS